MTEFLLITQVILSILITIAVILQKSSSGGMLGYSGSNESVFGAKGPTSFMVKFTLFIGVLFIANTIALSFFYNKKNQKSVVDEVQTSIIPTTPSIPATPLIPLAPPAPTKGDK